ncbi:MAG TPA: acetyl-CoA carboxylase biotin carboxyl carrier protein [Candidatus Limnocylindrales bacterium]|nr:acetyl-CoA carboxylase biotin carboxyl carrier protein [Candidatus Limnocylindrales bacterium]
MAKNPKTQPGSEARAKGVDLTEVERVLEFMQKHGLEEFEYERNDFRLRLKKPSAVTHAGFRAMPPAEIVVAAPSAPSEALSGPPKEAAGAGSEDLHVVKSPIVGTFYASPSPDAKAFVAPGAHVEPGDVLCIIEAMKLMNEIESDVAGEVVRVFVENGHPVEYGEPLFGIHPHRKK